MKNIGIYVAVMLLMALSACQQPYEKEYGLAVDSNEYAVSVNGKTFPVYVYCSSSWTASFSEPVAWAEIVEGQSGIGVGMVKINVKANRGEARSLNLVLRSGELEQNVLIRQGEYSVNYYVTFTSAEQTIAKGNYLAKTTFVTNISPESLAQSRPVSSDSWLTGLTGYTILSDNKEEGANRKVLCEFSFIVRNNDTASARSTELDIEGVGSLKLVQTAGDAVIVAPSVEPFSADAQECSIGLETNLTLVAYDMNVVTSEEFIRNPRVENVSGKAFLKFNIAENLSAQSRESDIKISYRDLKGVITEKTITVRQN